MKWITQCNESCNTMNYAMQCIMKSNELCNAMNYVMQWIMQWNELCNTMNYEMQWILQCNELTKFNSTNSTNWIYSWSLLKVWPNVNLLLLFFPKSDDQYDINYNLDHAIPWSFYPVRLHFHYVLWSFYVVLWGFHPIQKEFN